MDAAVGERLLQPRSLLTCMAARDVIPQQPRSESAALARRFEAIVFGWDGTARRPA
jgi:hypothetical protein